MNKTIIININGTVFHIEEDAYEILKNYMTDVKRHFFDSADSLEITTDIENRVAELFTEILTRENKQVIVEQDVRSVIAQMGTVEDFETETRDSGSETSAAYGSEASHRRLFRDPDDHLVAGVCAGIANYFDVPAVWIRLAFAITFLFFGTGFFLYIILWIIVPKAVTRADRMVMRGEPLDLQGFKRNFEAEVGALSGRLSDFHQEARPFIYKTRDFIGDFFHHLGRFFAGAGRVLIKLFGLIILLTCVGAIIALTVTVIMFLAYGSTHIYNLFPFNVVNREYNNIFLIGAYLTLFIPLLAVALFTIRLVFARDTMGRSLGSTLLIVWICAVSIVVYYSAKATAEFKSYASFSQNINIKPTANHTYYLKLNDVKYLTKEDSARLDIKDKFYGKTILSTDEDVNLPAPFDNITIEVEKSDVPQPVVVEQFSSRGSTYEEALLIARDVNYNFIQQDSVLKFDRQIRIGDRQLWRDQEVHLHVKLPLNSQVIIDRNLDRYLRGFDYWACKDKSKNDNTYTAAFIMTPEGLQCKADTVKTDTIKVTEKDSSNITQ